MSNPQKIRISSSFRDPHGFMFRSGEQLFRQVNLVGQADYVAARDSGLYQQLWNAKVLIPHEEIDQSFAFDPLQPPAAILKPDIIPFISYPYEWSFSMLKEAALLTLQIQELAIKHNFTLRDASAYNIQFINNRPIFIDTLSFEPLNPALPWMAYGQFCRHFLAPLALMALIDLRLGLILRDHIDGIPLDLAAKILGTRSWSRFHLLIHLALHGKLSASSDTSSRSQRSSNKTLSKTSQLALIDSLKSAISGLKLKTDKSVWSHYYSATNYSDAALEAKTTVVAETIEQLQPKSVWDLGCNTGRFSNLASQRGILTFGSDFDPLCIEYAYLQAIKEQRENVIFLTQDLTNPSPNLGWNLSERDSLIKRGPADLVIALALVHHLIIGNNLSTERLVEFFHGFSKHLLVEFVPKEDSQTQRLLSSRKDIFPNYNLADFKVRFEQNFKLVWEKPVAHSSRTLLLLEAL